MQLKLKIYFVFVIVTLLSRVQIHAEEVPTPNSQEAASNESKETESEETNLPIVEDVPSKPRSLSSCGQRMQKEIVPDSNDDGMHKTVTKFGEFPWTIALLEKPETVGKENFICGGVLISTNAVLTTANCVHGFMNRTKSLIAEAGEWNSLTPNDESPPQKRSVKHIEILEHYDKDFFMNNIALVVLESHFDFKDHIKPICLRKITENFDRRECVLTFWEVNAANLVLKKIDATVIPDEECGEKLKELEIVNNLPLHESIMCASGVDKGSACETIKGSLLICSIVGEENRFSLAGIASGAHDCAQEKFLGMFLNVALFRSWIDQIMRATGIPELYYAL